MTRNNFICKLSQTKSETQTNRYILGHNIKCYFSASSLSNHVCLFTGAMWQRFQNPELHSPVGWGNVHFILNQWVLIIEHLMCFLSVCLCKQGVMYRHISYLFVTVQIFDFRVLVRCQILINIYQFINSYTFRFCDNHNCLFSLKSGNDLCDPFYLSARKFRRRGTQENYCWHKCKWGRLLRLWCCLLLRVKAPACTSSATTGSRSSTASPSSLLPLDTHSASPPRTTWAPGRPHWPITAPGYSQYPLSDQSQLRPFGPCLSHQWPHVLAVHSDLIASLMWVSWKAPLN